jgi:hypothetical protein
MQQVAHHTAGGATAARAQVNILTVQTEHTDTRNIRPTPLVVYTLSKKQFRKIKITEIVPFTWGQFLVSARVLELFHSLVNIFENFRVTFLFLVFTNLQEIVACVISMSSCSAW